MAKATSKKDKILALSIAIDLLDNADIINETQDLNINPDLIDELMEYGDSDAAMPVQNEIESIVDELRKKLEKLESD